MATRRAGAWHPVKIAILAVVVLLGGFTPFPVELVASMQRAAARRTGAEYAAALDAYGQAQSLAPVWSLPWQARGEVLLIQGRYAEAASALREAERLGAGPDAILALGESLAGQGDWAGALRAWLRAQSLTPGDPRVYLALARGSIAQGSFQQAHSYLSACLDRDPPAGQAARAHALLGRLLAGEDPAAAAGHLRQAGDADLLAVLEAVEAEAEPARRELLLGAAFLQRNELALAHRHLARAVQLDANSAEAHAYLGHALDRLGETVAAERFLQQALALDPDSALAHYFLGSHHRRLGHVAQAQAALWQALQRDPQNAAFCVEMAEAFAGQPDYPRAEEWYRAAVEAEPEDAGFRLLLAQFYVDHLYQVEEAGVAAAEEAAAMVPADARAQDLLGWAYQLAGRPTEAEVALRRALALDPGLASAHFHLGSLYYRTAGADGSAQALARHHLQRASDLDTAGYYRARAELLLAGKP